MSDEKAFDAEEAIARMHAAARIKRLIAGALAAFADDMKAHYKIDPHDALALFLAFNRLPTPELSKQCKKEWEAWLKEAHGV
jgi:hypothetical protein